MTNLSKIQQESLREFDEAFPGEMITVEDGKARIETRAVTCEAIKSFISHHLSLAYEAGVEQKTKCLCECHLPGWNGKKHHGYFIDYCCGKEENL